MHSRDFDVDEADTLQQTVKISIKTSYSLQKLWVHPSSSSHLGVPFPPCDPQHGVCRTY